MASIALVRIDSRLIHGQVITKWMKMTNANRIVVIDNKMAQDPLMSKIYIMAAPPGVKVQMVTVDDSVAAWQKDKMGTGTIIVLFKSVASAVEAWQKGFPIARLQVGGLAGAPGRKVVFNQITLNAEDTELLKKMREGGVGIILQTVPEDTAANFDDIAKNLKF